MQGTLNTTFTESLERLVEPLEKAVDIIEQAWKDEFETEQPVNKKGQSRKEKSSES
jgi:hypothetical protein